MKDNKVKRIRQNIAMFKRQFLQDDADVFGQALGDPEEVAAVWRHQFVHDRRNLLRVAKSLAEYVCVIL